MWIWTRDLTSGLLSFSSKLKVVLIINLAKLLGIILSKIYFLLFSQYYFVFPEKYIYIFPSVYYISYREYLGTIKYLNYGVDSSLIPSCHIMIFSPIKARSWHLKAGITFHRRVLIFVVQLLVWPFVSSSFFFLKFIYFLAVLVLPCIMQYFSL